MFRQIEHPLIGETKTYLPADSKPCILPLSGRVVTFPGDIVTVDSAWTRDYLKAGAPDLLYVTSLTTGYSTHVTASDLV